MPLIKGKVSTTLNFAGPINSVELGNRTIAKEVAVLVPPRNVKAIRTRWAFSVKSAGWFGTKPG